MKIRDDLDGVIYIGDQAYAAGDELPAGAAVADSLLAKDAPANDAPAEKPASKRPTRKAT